MTPRTINRKYILGGVLFALGVWCVNLWLALPASWSENERGTFGDTFGMVNSIFSGLAFIGVVWSVSTQREELEVARKEMKATQKILEKQEDNIREQKEATKLQSFETTFFQLFKLLTDITTSMRYTYGQRDEQGKEVVERFRKIIEDRYKKETGRQHVGVDGQLVFMPLEGDPDKEALRRAYKGFYDRYGDDVGHYYRSLYTVINFIDRADINEDSKWFYAKLVRAQLTSGESALLLANYLVGHTTPEFDALLEKYGLIKNANDIDLLTMDFRQLANPEVFGRKYVEECKSKQKLTD